MAMPPPTPSPGEGGHISSAFGTQADVDFTIGSFAEQDGHRHRSDGTQEIDETLRVGRARSRLGEHFLTDLGGCQPVLSIEGKRRQNPGQQTQTLYRGRVIDLLRNECRVGASRHQASGDLEYPLIGVGKAKSPRIGENAGIEGRGEVAVDGKGQPETQIVEHFTGAARSGVVPEDIAKALMADMMIDADQERNLSDGIRECRSDAPKIAAIHENGHFVSGRLGNPIANRFHQGEEAVGHGYRVVAVGIGLLAQLAQHLRHGQDGTDSVAIRPNVGGNQKALVELDRVGYFLNHVSRRVAHPGASLSANVRSCLHNRRMHRNGMKAAARTSYGGAQPVPGEEIRSPYLAPPRHCPCRKLPVSP